MRIKFVIKKTLIYVVMFITLIFEPYSFCYLSENVVIESALKHYPKVQASLLEVEASLARIDESRGAFDLSFSVKADKRFRGYYDGDSAKLELRKPLRFAGASVYSGYKVSDGEFPDYEGKRDTLSGGEYRAGIEFSLLKNRRIDANRFTLLGNKIRSQQSRESARLIQSLIKRDAKVTYWKWLTSGLIRATFSELLGFAKKRDRAIRKRSKNGDLARIYVDENQQYILKWRQKFNKANLDFFKMAQKLSLYYRDTNGKPLVVTESQLPKKFVSTESIKDAVSKVSISELVRQNPEILNINYDIEIAQNQLDLAQNSKLPELDLSFELSKDEGSGSRTLRPTENRAFLNLKIPLQNRKARGKIQQVKSKQGILSFKKQLLSNKIAIGVENLRRQIKTYRNIVKLSYRETLLTKKLLKAEERKFSQGASDFFVVNLRETNHANAKIDNLKALVMFKAAIAEYESLVFAK